MAQKQSVLIVGAGEFGASTALSLLKTGKYTVTIIDRAPVLPAIDAASTDINKVVRWDYSDRDYAKLARESIDLWNKDFKGIYHQSGVVVRGLHTNSFDGHNAKITYDNVKGEPGVKLLSTPSEITGKLSPRGVVPTATVPSEERSYWNPVGGWAWAAKAVEKLYEQIIPLGGKLYSNAELASLIIENGDVKGVRTVDGREWKADKIVVCTGSWTAANPALRGLLPEGLITATGQTIAAVQLDEEEMEKYKDIPVSFNFDGSGFYSFPPTHTGLVKFAIHGAGFTSPNGLPRTHLDPQACTYTEQNQVGWIPKESLHALRKQMSLVYPELAKKPVAYTRMCWYSDVVDGDWVIDYTKYPSLLIAAGGSGHAFKFLPVMGDLIRKRLENTLEPHLTQKWRINRTPAAEDPQRTGMARKQLDLSQLATRKEMVLGETGVSARL